MLFDCAVTKFLRKGGHSLRDKEGGTLKEICKCLTGVYGSRVFCYNQVANRFKQYWLGRKLHVGQLWCGRPSDTITPDKFVAVECIITNARRAKVAEIAIEINTLIGCVQAINYQ